MKTTARLALWLCLTIVFSCTDSGTGPSADAARMRIALRPVYSAAPTSYAAGAIQRIRLVARDEATQQIVGTTVVEVDPDRDEWPVSIEFVPSSATQRIVISIELLSLGAGGAEVVEWSGRTEPIAITPGGTTQRQDVLVHPGPLDNLSVTGLRITQAPVTLLEGDTGRVLVEVQSTGGTPRLVWSSLDTTIVRIDATGGVRAVLPGIARVVVAAGTHRDSANIRVRPRPTRVTLTPATAALTYLGAEAGFTATVLDARNAPIDSLTLDWQLAPAGVVELVPGGRVRATAVGSTTLTVALAGSPPLSASATITVAQTPAVVRLEPAAVTLEARGATTRLVASVADAGGAAIENAAVSWSSSNPAVATVDAAGTVTAVADGTTTITASAGSASATSAIRVARVARQLAITAGDGQSAAVGSALPVVPAVRVTDANGFGMDGITVTFSVSEGSLTSASATSDAEGIARAGVWTLGPRAGTQTLRAEASGLAAVQFTATARPDAPAAFVATAGDAQSGTVATPLPIDPSVRITDRFDNPLAGITVTYAVGANGGSITPASVATDADGRASAQWTLGSLPGEYTVTAATAGLPELTFRASAQAGPPAAIVALSATSQAGTVGELVGAAPTVRVTDIAGNALAGAAVSFTVAQGEGNVSSPGASGTTGNVTYNTTTDASGVASVRWRLGTGAGSNVLEVSAGEAGSLQFTAEARAAAPARIEIVQGEGQSAPVGLPVPVPPLVRVLDGFGNPVAEAAISFAVTMGGGTLSGAMTTTDVDGAASAGTWTLGARPGVNQLSVTVEGLTPIVFTANGITGTPASLAIHAGDAQSATAGSSVAIPPAVIVKDALANPVAGVSVTFAVTAGGGALTGATAVTDSLGIASAGSWTLGATPGTNTLSASAATLPPVTFTATGTAVTATPGFLVRVSGDGQAPLPNGDLPLPMVVKVFDNTESPLSGITLNWIAGGGSSVRATAVATPGTTATSVTQADGSASALWTVLPSGPAQTLKAYVTGLADTVTFTWSNPCLVTIAHTPGTTTTSTFASGDCVENDALVERFTFTLETSTALTVALAPESFGYAYDLWLNGRSVLAVVGSDPGTLTMRHLLPPGSYQLNVHPLSPTLGDYTFTTVLEDPDVCEVPVLITGASVARNLASTDCGGPTGRYDVVSLAIPADSAVLLSASAAFPLRLEVLDGSGNPLATSGPGATNASVLVSGDGTGGLHQVRIWTLSSTDLGAYTLSAVRAPRPAGMAVSAGDAQTATAGTTLTTAPAVRVHDAAGAPLAGVNVTFAVASGGGSVTNAVGVTGADGIASVGSWTLGPLAGANTLTAFAQGLATGVTFTATGTQATPALALSLGTRTFVGVSFTAPLTVSTNTPAPAGGLTVSVSSGDATRLTVASPGTVTIAEGATSATIVLQGVSAGSATLTATAAGHTSATLPVSVSLRLISLPTTLNVAYGSSASMPIQLAEPAPAGGTVVTLTSSDPSRVSVGATVTIAAGSLTGNATVQGVLPGPATITAAATEYISGSAAVTTTANLDIVESSISLNPTFPTGITVRLRSAGNAVAAPAPGLTVTLTSNDAVCASVPTTVTIPTGLTETSTTVTHGGAATLPCYTRVIATASNIAADSVSVSVGATPNITLYGPIQVGAGLQTSTSGYLSVSNHNGVTVRVQSPNPSKLLISRTSSGLGTEYVDIPVTAGNTGFSFYLQALENVTDTVAVTASSTGFTTGTLSTRIVQTAYDVQGLNLSAMTMTADDAFYARVGIPYVGLGSLQEVQPLRAGSPGLTFTFTVNDVAVGALLNSADTGSTVTARMEALQSNTPTSVSGGGVAFRPLTAGSATVSGTVPALSATAQATRVVTVTSPYITLYGSTVGAGLQTSSSGYLSASNHGGVTVRVTSPNPAKLLVSTSASAVGSEYVDIPVLNGNSSFYYYLQALEEVTDTLSLGASAPGFTSGSASVQIRRISYDLQGVNSNTTTLTGDDAIYARVGLPYEDLSGLYELQPLRAGSPGLAFTFTISDPALASLITTTETAATTVTVTLAALQQNTPTSVTGGGLAVRPRAAGALTVAASVPGLAPTAAATRTQTISAPAISVYGATVGSGLQTSSSAYLGASSHGGITVRVTSPDPAKLLISKTGTAVGAEFQDFVLADGNTGLTFYLQALEAVTDTFAVTVSAPQFTSGTATVSIIVPGVDVAGLSTSTTTLSADDPFVVRVGLPYSGLSALYELQSLRAGSPGFTATVSSSAPAGQLITTAASGGTVTVPMVANNSNSPSTVAAGGVALRPLTAGTTTISASIPGFATLASSAHTVTIAAPGITMYSSRVGAGLQTYSSGYLGAPDHGGVTVRVSSSNATVALISPNATTPGSAWVDIPVAAGNTYFTYYVQGVEGASGTVTVTAAASGFTDGTTTTQVVPAGFQIAALSTTGNTASGDDNLYVQVGIPYATNAQLSETQPVRAGATPLQVTLTTSNAGVGTLWNGTTTASSVTLSIAAGAANTPTSVAGGGVALRPVAAGTTTVTAAIPGLTGTAGASRAVTYVQPGLRTDNATVGAGLQRQVWVYLDGSWHGGVTVRLTSADPGRLLLAPDASTAGASFIDVVVPDGSSSASFYVQGVTAGTPVNIALAAPGFASGTGSINIVQAAFAISGLATTSTAAGANDDFNVYVGVPYTGNSGFSEYQNVRVGTTLTVTLTSGTAATGQLVTTAATGSSVTVTIPAGSYYTPSGQAAGGVAFDPLAAGTTTVTASIPGLVPLSPGGAVTVTVN